MLSRNNNSTRYAANLQTTQTPDSAIAPGRDDDAAGALALARALGGLPLALVIAGAMIRSDQLGFAEYLGKVAEIIAREPKNDDYPNSVIGALRLSYDRLDSDAKQIADVFAWFAPEGLEAGLILDAPGGRWEFNKTDMPENLQELAQASGRVAAGIEALVDRSILRRGTAGYELHRMSAAALRAMQGDALLNGAAAALLAAVYPYDSDHSGNWPACRRLTPHLRALWGSGDAPKIAAMDFLLNQASVFLDRIGDVQGDLELARASLSLTEARLPEEDRAIAVGHANLGGSLYRSGDLEGAEASLRRAIALDEAHRPESIDLAESYDLLGAVLLDKGRGGAPDALWQSLRAYQKSAAILRHYVPRASDARAQALNNIGAVRDVLGQAAAALRLAEFSLAIRRQILPAGEARLGYGLMNTGSSALTSGAAERAEPLLSEALYLRRSVYIEAPKHPEIVTTADWLVACLLTRARGGEDAAARQAQARALSDEFGFDYDHYVELAKQYPYTPKGT
jgi:tetratricopeptide (TPR) repeat protein